MIYNFDPERWFDIESAAREKAWREGALERDAYDAALDALQQKLDALWDNLDGSYRREEPICICFNDLRGNPKDIVIFHVDRPDGRASIGHFFFLSRFSCFFSLGVLVGFFLVSFFVSLDFAMGWLSCKKVVGVGWNDSTLFDRQCNL